MADEYLCSEFTITNSETTAQTTNAGNLTRKTIPERQSEAQSAFPDSNTKLDFTAVPLSTASQDYTCNSISPEVDTFRGIQSSISSFAPGIYRSNISPGRPMNMDFKSAMFIGSKNRPMKQDDIIPPQSESWYPANVLPPNTPLFPANISSNRCLQSHNIQPSVYMNTTFTSGTDTTKSQSNIPPVQPMNMDLNSSMFVGSKSSAMKQDDVIPQKQEVFKQSAKWYPASVLPSM